jgi:putative transposase
MAIESRKRHPRDLSDEQWELIEPLTPLQSVTPQGGRPRAVDMREVPSTNLYMVRSGCQWDMLQHDLLAESTVYEDFERWLDDRTLTRSTAS